MRGFGFRLWLLTRVSTGIIVARCIKVAKNDIQQQRAGLAERAGAGGAVVVGSHPA